MYVLKFAEIWESEEEALDYAASFQGGDSYRPYEIVQRAYEVHVIVED
jgi:hypothetical protein